MIERYLTWSLELLVAAIILGVLLFAVAVQFPRLRWPGWVHGGVGLAGLALLLLAQGGPPRGAKQGAGFFGVIAAVFVTLAAALGLWVFTRRLRRHPPSMLVIAIHASLAVAGAVMLAAYVTAS